MSPSLGREWIEILQLMILLIISMSPSLGREWIEIYFLSLFAGYNLSPSLGREWIEIINLGAPNIADAVSLLGEGVD